MASMNPRVKNILKIIISVWMLNNNSMRLGLFAKLGICTEVAILTPLFFCSQSQNLFHGSRNTGSKQKAVLIRCLCAHFQGVFCLCKKPKSDFWWDRYKCSLWIYKCATGPVV